MPQDPSSQIRKQLVELLRSGYAHVGFEQVVRAFPPERRGSRPPGAPHTAWQLLEHMRIAQWDILEFSRDSKHQSPKWPDGYWPKPDAPPDDRAWNHSIDQFEADLKAFEALIKDKARDLFEPFPHGDGQNLLREALTLADHNSYHLGQLAFLLKQFGLEP